MEMVGSKQEYIVDIDETNAARWLIEESQQRPVIIDFWADWCEPCKMLMPILEKLADEYQGAFVLARVNADSQQMIAQQFGVRSLPTVIVMQGGQPVDGFAGAQPEGAVREMLQKYLPSPWDSVLQKAAAHLEAGETSDAIAVLRPAYEESGRKHEIAMAYALALIEGMRLDEAEAVLDAVKIADQDAAYEQCRAQLEIRREAAKSPEMTALEEQLAGDPDNLDLRAQLALHYTAAGQYREGLGNLFTVLQRQLDHDNGRTRKALLDTIASLGKGDPLAAEFQRKLYSLLY
ncbi:MAG: thioredoxin [Chromatocurvus sp.]